MMMRFWIAVVWALMVPFAALAHEVRPAIADLTVTNGTLQLDIALNAEALIAGIDLDGVTDTDETEASDTVDALRALEADALIARFSEIAPDFAASVVVQEGDINIPLQFTEMKTDPAGDVSLPRDSLVTLTADVPAGSQFLTVTWPAQYGTLILRQQGVEEPYTGTLTGGATSAQIELIGGAQQSGWTTFAQYIPVGFDHILPKGLDHILFVLGLFFLSTALRSLVWQISAFTLAHTVTLALAVLGYVSVPASIVEPLIAASIVYVAVENILSDKLQRWRPYVIFGFGLLHGLGFASVLGDFGLPEGQIVPALIGFNIGVEIGQLTVIAIAFFLVWYAVRVDRAYGDIRTGQVLYAALALGFVALSFAMNTPGFAQVMGAGAPIFFGPLAAISVLCALSIYNVDKLDAYRNFVAIPVSLAIALVGAYWFVERVFL